MPAATGAHSPLQFRSAAMVGMDLQACEGAALSGDGTHGHKAPHTPAAATAAAPRGRPVAFLYCGMARTGTEKKKTAGGVIVANRKARHDYAIDEHIEAGLELLGWEVKALRAGRGQIVDSFVVLRDGEAFLQGLTITPLASASSHVVADPQRLRRLLLHRREIARVFSATQQKGYTCVALDLHWKDRHVKCEIALAKGRKQYDKRAQARDEDWKLEKRRLMSKRSA